jgi:hypothetical protein
MATATASPTKFNTGKVRLSYTYLLSPRVETGDNGEVKSSKYSVTLLIPKSDKKTVDAIKNAQKAAAKEGASKLGKIPPSGFNPAWSTLHDGDEEKDTEEQPEYKGCMYLQATSKQKPGIIDLHGNQLTTEDEVYPGMYGRVNLTCMAYNSGTKKGVTFYLNHVQKMEDGDNLAGRTKPEDVFDILDSEDENLI